MKPPRVGHVIRYAYLWDEEARRGREEGRKDRPCAVVIATSDADGRPVYFVAPVTHVAPKPDSLAVEIPIATKGRLSLDDARSWVVTNELNKFTWPGPDIRPGADGEVIIGYLPEKLVRRIIDNVRAHAGANSYRHVSRDSSE